MLLAGWEGGPESDLDPPEANSGNHSAGTRGVSYLLNNSLQLGEHIYLKHLVNNTCYHSYYYCYYCCDDDDFIIIVTVILT